jgi:hypothetical protein
MTASASIRIEGQITSLPSGSVKVGPIDLTSADASGQTQWVVLQSGANTITTPASPTPRGCVITLPATNTALTTLKGVTGDTGVPIGKTGTTVLDWTAAANAPTSFCLTSSATQTGLATSVVFF